MTRAHFDFLWATVVRNCGVLSFSVLTLRSFTAFVVQHFIIQTPPSSFRSLERIRPSQIFRGSWQSCSLTRSSSCGKDSSGIKSYKCNAKMRLCNIKISMKACTKKIKRFNNWKTEGIIKILMGKKNII